METYLKHKVTIAGDWSASLERGVVRPALLTLPAGVRVSGLVNRDAQSFKWCCSLSAGGDTITLSSRVIHLKFSLKPTAIKECK